MAIPRKLWSALKPGTRKRKLAFYRKQGLSDKQIAARYNSGKLGSQTAARGHSATPERPSDAYKHPDKYRNYLAKRRKSETGGPPVSWRQQAYENIQQKIGHYKRYNDRTVRRHCFRMMTRAEAEWTIQASEDMIVSRATVAWGLRLFDNQQQSPWWYH